MIRLFLACTALFLVLPAPAEAATVIGIVIKLAVAFKAALTVKAIAVFVLRAALTAGITLLSQKRRQKNRSAGISTTHTTSGGRDPQGTIVGKYATGGHVTYRNSFGRNNRYFVEVIEVSDLPGVAFSRLIIDGEYSELGDTEHPDYGFPILSKRTNTTDRAWLRFYDGTQTSADPLLVAEFSEDPDRPWTENHIGTGIPYFVLTYEYHPPSFDNGEPSERFELIGVPFYDPRKDTSVGGAGAHRWGNPATWEPTKNPLVILYNGMRGIDLPGGRTWGGKCDLDDLPLDVWTPQMDVCDFVPDGSNRAQFECGFEIRFNEQPAEVFPELLAAANAQIAELGGTWYVQAGAPAAASTHITDGDIIVSEGRQFDPFPDAGQTFNAIVPSHASPGALWNATTLVAITNTAWEAADAGQRLFEIRLPSVFSSEQARQLAQNVIRDNRRFRQHVQVLPPEYFHLNVLQTIDWTSEWNSYAGKSFEIVDVAYDLRKLRLSVSLRERDQGDFVHDPDIELPSPPQALVPIPRPDSGLPGFAVLPVAIKDAAGHDRRPAIALVWSTDITGLIGGIEWELRRVGSSGIEDAGSTAAVATGYCLIPGVLPATDYELHARPLSAVRHTYWTIWKSVTTFDIRLDALDIADEVNDAITDAQARADVAFDRHDAALDSIDGTLGELRDRLGVNLGVSATAPVIGPVVPLDAQVLDLDTNLGLAVERLDFEVPQIRDGRNQLDGVMDHLLALQVDSFVHGQRLVDAGIYEDPDGGRVLIAGVAQAETRLADVLVEIDALAATVKLSATLTDVDYRVGQALLTPEQNPLVSDLVTRTTDLEVLLDAETGRIDSLSATLIVDGETLTMTTVSQRLDSLASELVLRVTTEQFEATEEQIGDVQLVLSSMDAPQIAYTVAATRKQTAALDDAEDATIAGLGRALNEGEELRRADAGGRRALRAYVDEEFAASAEEVLELKAQTTSTAAALTEERTTRATESEAQAAVSTQLQADLTSTAGDQAGTAEGLEELTVRVTETETGIQSEAQQTEYLASGNRLLDAAGEALNDQSLAAIMDNWQGWTQQQTAVAIVLRQARTFVDEQILAEAEERSVLIAKLELTQASIVTEQKTRATEDGAQAERSSLIEATINDPASGLSAAHGEIGEMNSVSVTSDSALVQAHLGLVGVVNNPDTGLPAVQGELNELNSVSLTSDSALVQAHLGLVGVVNNPDTGLPAVQGELNELNSVSVTSDSALVQAHLGLESSIFDPQNGASITARLQTIETTYVDANGAVAAVEQEISASYGGLTALAVATAAVTATVDGISASYVWKLNGQNTFEMVSLSDGTTGPTVTGKISSDYLRITGTTEMDEAVFQRIAGEAAFLQNLTVTTANMGTTAVRTLHIDDNAVSFDLVANNVNDLLPLAGWRFYLGIAVSAAYPARITFLINVAQELTDPLLDQHWSYELRRRSDGAAVVSNGDTVYQGAVLLTGLIQNQPAGLETYDLYVSFGNGVTLQNASIIAGVSYK